MDSYFKNDVLGQWNIEKIKERNDVFGIIYYAGLRYGSSLLTCYEICFRSKISHTSKDRKFGIYYRQVDREEFYTLVEELQLKIVKRNEFGTVFAKK